jgi:hypothetical protein
VFDVFDVFDVFMRLYVPCVFYIYLLPTRRVMLHICDICAR